MLSITLIIIIVNVIVSILAWNNKDLMDKLIFNPVAVTEHKQYYRFITSGFLHADMKHLIFNMISLYLFGSEIYWFTETGQTKQGVEQAFIEYFGGYGKTLYLIMYLLALIAALLPTYFKHKYNNLYRSLGASGAVSAVVFIGILISPLSKIGFFIIPPIIPGFVFGPLYLLISWTLDRKGGDNINHSAHIWGALFGVIFIIVLSKYYGTTDVLENFIEQVKYYFKTF